MPPTRLLDATGRPVGLAPAPLGVGGEGAVFDVAGMPDLVAKVYHKVQSPERCRKLAAMAASGTADLRKVAAWPTMTLHEARGGPVWGILMPKVAGCNEAHHLYSVAQRKRDYPDVDYKFLIRAARNSAAAFEAIHRQGHVVGDVNQKNVMVSPQAIIHLVDCDSFQVRDPAGRIYRCEVGVPEYTPPELQGRSFRDIDRDANHDRFGLAVLIFHMLMMGRHPFSGLWQGSGEMPIEKAIAEGRYAYARGWASGMKPPPNTPPLALIDPSILDLFERAFAPAGRSGPPARPTPAEWEAALAMAEGRLGRCASDPKHVYSTALAHCPWCDLLATANVVFFLPGTGATFGSSSFDLAAIWAQIEAVALSNAAYRPRATPAAAAAGRAVPPKAGAPTPQPALLPMPGPPGKPDTFLEKLAGVGSLAGGGMLFVAPPVGWLCLVGFGLWYFVLIASKNRRWSRLTAAHRGERKQVAEINAASTRAWEAENVCWCREYRGRTGARDSLVTRLSKVGADIGGTDAEARVQHADIRRTLEAAKARHAEQRRQHDDALADLARRSHQIQLDNHLDSLLIRDARIKAMSPNRISNLRSFGIETAADVERLNGVKVPDIGPIMTQRLFEWRAARSAGFRPRPGVPEAEKSAVARRYLPGLGQLEKTLAAGPARLREVVQRHQARRSSLIAEAQQLARALAQARADVEVMDAAMAAARP